MVATPGSSARGRGPVLRASSPHTDERPSPAPVAEPQAAGGEVRERHRAKQHSEGRRFGRPHHIDVGGRRASVLDRNARHDRIERHIRRCRRSLHHSFGQGMFDPRALHTREPYRPARTAKPTRERSPNRDKGVLVDPSGCATRMRHPGSPGSTPDSAHAPAHRAPHDCSPDPHSLRSPAKTRTGQALTVEHRPPPSLIRANRKRKERRGRQGDKGGRKL